LRPGRVTLASAVSSKDGKTIGATFGAGAVPGFV
jgi:hypothetical protein